MNQQDLIDDYIKEIEYTLKFRTAATERLQRNDFWLQTCNIYYSCFTAILAIVCLKSNDESLSLWSTIFTITVAILVSFSNSLKYSHRVNDLRANCNDLKISYIELTTFKSNHRNTSVFNDTLNKKFNMIINDYLQKLNDSEYHSVVDIWKSENPPKYVWFYCVPLVTFWIILFMLPIAFSILKWKFSPLLPF